MVARLPFFPVSSSFTSLILIFHAAVGVKFQLFETYHARNCNIRCENVVNTLTFPSMVVISDWTVSVFGIIQIKRISNIEAN